MAKREPEKREDALSGLMKSRLSRVPNANSGGLAAMTIGLTLGGCVAFGYFVGAWLDRRYGTSLWMPIGVFVGMAAGFREMFVTLKKLSAQTKWPSSKSPQTSQNDEITRNRVLDSSDEAANNTTGVQEPERNRPRIFQVPQPPTASFDTREKTPEPNEDDISVESLDTQELTDKLLDKKLDDQTSPQ